MIKLFILNFGEEKRIQFRTNEVKISKVMKKVKLRKLRENNGNHRSKITENNSYKDNGKMII